MKYIRKFNENKSELSKEDLSNFFAHTYDMCESGTAKVINTVYFNPDEEMSWAHNDFSTSYETYDDVECVEGYELSFHVEYWDKTTLDEFDKYVEVVTQLKEDIDRFKSMYNPSEIFFENNDDSIIRLLIRP